MEIRDIKYLIALYEERSVSKAANRLYIAQSSLSEFLSRYEKNLGIKLFKRIPKGIEPTYNGSLYIEHLKDISLNLERALNELYENENLKGGMIRFGISTFRGQIIMPKILKIFNNYYPNIRVKIIEADSLGLEKYLNSAKLDLAIIVTPTSIFNGNIEPIKRDEIVICAHESNEICNHIKVYDGIEYIDVRDLNNREFILGSPSTILGKKAREIFGKNNIKYESFNDTISAELALSLAENNEAISFSYKSVVIKKKNVKYLRVGINGEFLNLAIAYPNYEYNFNSVSTLVNLIKKVY